MAVLTYQDEKALMSETHAFLAWFTDEEAEPVMVAAIEEFYGVRHAA